MHKINIMKYYIYIIKNTINNKVYVGSTKNIKTRKYSHFRLLKNNSHHSHYLQKSFNKYGIKHFIFECISEHDDNYRKETELETILRYKSNNSLYGYNLWVPDDSNINFTCVDSVKKRIKEAHINNNYSISVTAYNIQTGDVIGEYSSLKECSSKLNVHIAIIHDIINKKNHRLSYKQMTFRRKEELYDYKHSSKQRFST